MDALINKISSYNIFNYIIPGVVFCYFFNSFFGVKIDGEQVIYNFCLYYFWGLLISRIGSLVVEVLSVKLKFVIYAPYHDYSNAVKKNSDIKILLEMNNMFRTFSSVFMSLFFIELLFLVISKIPLWHVYATKFSIDNTIVSLILFLLMMFSYRKQTQYIVKKVNYENSTN